jgi:predicted transposase YbfD/YdcC
MLWFSPSLFDGGVPVTLKAALEQVPDPRGRQGKDYHLWSILALIIVSLLLGRRGVKAAFLLGRSLTREQKRQLGFSRGYTPCHATLTETLRIVDAQRLADVLGAVSMVENGDPRHIAIDGKTMRASKDGEGKATHVLSAFCGGLQTVLGHEASRGKGLEIPDALTLLGRLDLTGRIVTGDAIFCQKSIAAQIIKGGGDYLLQVKDNQKTLREDIVTAFDEPVVSLSSFDSGYDKAHGRIERRCIDVLPATAAGIKDEWPGVSQIIRIGRSRQYRKNGIWQEPETETVYLITSMKATGTSPQALLALNREHWGIEIMHRDKDVILGEDGYTNRLDNAPRNVFSLLSLVRKIRNCSPPPPAAIILIG